ncbi:Cupin, RmlC-type [Akanthomyces lecanii RCEF 1005]|uniref:Cupin, RmlC-type n=1 Tax=Akanthomyces lecanii RCEF 1005 TaxID=1081108 RepID=A0A168F6T7_CORDF|nr:Cupin, RmlC-type [Akanthomyces lecanii RCEF 1005]
MSSPRPDGQRTAGHVPVPLVPRMVSQVPLPPYAQPTQTQDGTGGKLMSLNSTIMAAQREWEEKNQAGGASSAESTYSESAASTASDEQPSPGSVEEVLPSMGSSRGPAAGKKRSLVSVNLGTSSRPAKRRARSPILMALKRPPGSSLSSSRAGQSRAPSPAQRNTQNGTNYSAPGENEWLQFNSWDAIDYRADGIAYHFYYDRGCSKAFASAKALGGHFSSGHKGNAYNDNCDGTLSKVGFYDKIVGEKWQAIVVSRVSVTGSEKENPHVSTPGPFTTAHVAMTTPDPFTYVTGFLPRHVDFTKFLNTAYIRELCELPKRRQLPASWIKFHRNKDLSERMFALAVAYVTGREVFGMDVCLEGLHEDGSRLSRHSVAVPFELSAAQKRLYFPEDSCIGCYYYTEFHGKESIRCSWLAQATKIELHRYEKRVDGLSDSDEDDGDFAYHGTEDRVAKERQWARGVDSAIKLGKAARFQMPSLNPLSRASQPPSQEQAPLRDSGRASGSGSPNVASVHQRPAERPSSTFVYDQVHTRTETATTPTHDSRPRRESAVSRPKQHQTLASTRTSRSATALHMPVPSISPEPWAQPSPPTQTPSTQASHPVQAPPAQLQMESWEVAPGRMVDATHGENIGYSNAYLNGREPVEVSQDVAFNVITIKPGDKARWEAHESQLRTCSVASGKIEIKIGTNKFGMGPNSVFIIRPGETCVVTNKLYVDATVHCTTVKNYSLLS